MKNFILFVLLLALVGAFSFLIRCSANERCKDFPRDSNNQSQRVKLVSSQWDKIAKLDKKLDDNTDQIAYLVTWQETQTKILNDIESKLDKLLLLLEKEPAVKGPEDNKWW